MALQVNVPLAGGITHSNGYVRVVDARVCKKDNTDDWFLMVDVAAYKNASERGQAAPELLQSSAIDRFKFAYTPNDETDSNIVALSYAKLKTESVFDGASNV
jgi:hypothetical protein